MNPYSQRGSAGSPASAMWITRRLQIMAAALLLFTSMRGIAADESARKAAAAALDQLTFDRTACVTVENQKVKLVVDPAHGGRIVEYSLEGRNILYDADPEHPDRVFPFSNHYMGPAGGRFDIGPEDTIPEHLELWQGAWTVEGVEPRGVRLASVKDQTLGIQLTREFRLGDADSSVTCIQTIRNVSGETQTYGHWFRTFARGGGICVVPLTPGSRFPNHYLSFGQQVNTRPKDRGVTERDRFLLVDEVPNTWKIGLDSYAGWFAYFHPSNLLLIKQFPVYPDRRYSDITGLTVALWFDQNRRIVELESLGPEEVLAPGQAASYYETWWLLPAAYPGTGAAVDLKQLQALVSPLLRKP